MRRVELTRSKLPSGTVDPGALPPYRSEREGRQRVGYDAFAKPSRKGRFLRISFSNVSRAGASSRCRRFRVPVFSARSLALDGVSWVQSG